MAQKALQHNTYATKQTENNLILPNQPITMLSILQQPPEVWYKDQHGRKGTFSVQIQKNNQFCSHCAHFRNLSVDLLYESGKLVDDQSILKVQGGSCLNQDMKTELTVRVTQVSKNHQNQRFCLRISLSMCPEMRHKGNSVITIPLLILSKKNKRKEVLECTETKRLRNDPTFALIEDPQIAWDMQEPKFREKAQVDILWANAAYSFLHRLQFTQAKDHYMRYMCPICGRQYQKTPEHEAQCDLFLLLEPHMEQALTSHSPLEASIDDHSKVFGFSGFSNCPSSPIKLFSLPSDFLISSQRTLKASASAAAPKPSDATLLCSLSRVSLEKFSLLRASDYLSDLRDTTTL